MAQHSTLTLKRWSSFPPAQQILIIANEMNRAKKLFYPLDINGLKLCYERILYLTDLTAEANVRRGLRKELLRWRNLAAEEYMLLSQNSEKRKPDINRHLKIFRELLFLHPESAKQIAYLM